uniref:Uncharacterized protein n=1 Tax=Moorena producens (strain JHB) TaxID=1454205 RepID=A0A1D9FZQ5_MOOP1
MDEFAVLADINRETDQHQNNYQRYNNINFSLKEIQKITNFKVQKKHNLVQKYVPSAVDTIIYQS